MHNKLNTPDRYLCFFGKTLASCPHENILEVAKFENGFIFWLCVI